MIVTRLDKRSGQVCAALRLEALFAGHREAVARYVRRRAPAEAVDDVVAETFLIAWRRLDRVPTQSPLPWLLAVARNLIAHQQRSTGRRHALSLRLRELATPGEQESHVPELVGPLVDAVASLSEQDREALELVVIDGLKPQEAARVLGMPSSTFRARLHRAKRRFRRLVEEQRQRPAPSGPSTQPLAAEGTRTAQETRT